MLLRTRTRKNCGIAVMRVLPCIQIYFIASSQSFFTSNTLNRGRMYFPLRAAMPDNDRVPEPRAKPNKTFSAWSSRV